MDALDPQEALETHRMQRCCEFSMEKWFLMSKRLGITEARTKEEFYGFYASDIVQVHYRVTGYCDVVFLRLRDGRVFDFMAREHNPDPVFYDQTIH